MHATTLGQLARSLGSYVAPGQSFAPALNQALEVVYGMGIWKDLTIEGSFDVSDNYLGLPDQADTVLFAVVDTQPVRTRSLWHDYRAAGTNYDSTLLFGLIDDGYRPTLKNLSGSISTLYVVPASDTVDDTDIDLDSGESIDSIGFGETKKQRGTVAVVGSDTTITFASPVVNLESLQFSGLLHRYDIREDKDDPATTVATVGPGDGVARFRRYRVPSAKPGSIAHVLCKRRFIPLQNEDDIVYIAQIGALKHALLAILAEDNADLERSEIHWSKCRQMLDEQLDQYRGPARPSLDLQMNGDGIIGIRNQY